jgi:D-lactate dehydrogenase (cytochrome)
MVLFRGGSSRTRTSGPGQVLKSVPVHSPKVFWTTGRVLLFSAFTGTAAYLFGINDASQLQLPWTKSAGPQYASKKDMEKASRLESMEKYHC